MTPPGGMMASLGLAIALAVGLSGCPANTFAGEFPDKSITGDLPEDAAPLAEILEWFEKTSAKVRIGLDPVARQIACRVAFQPFTAEALAKAMHLSEEKIWQGFKKLTEFRLVGIDLDGDRILIAPAGKAAAKAMQHWSREWCTSDDECGVAR